MALTRKPSAQLVTSPAFNLPDDMPRLPEEVTKRFPSAEKYEAAMERWWYEVRKVLQRLKQEDSESLTQKFTAFTTTTETQALQARIAALESAVADRCPPTPVSADEIESIIARLLALESQPGGPSTTDGLPEGSSNLYFTADRCRAVLLALITSIDGGSPASGGSSDTIISGGGP
jgi:hypothetical protein